MNKWLSFGALPRLMILIEANAFVINAFGTVKIPNTLHSNDLHHNIYVCTLLVFSRFDNSVSPVECKKPDGFGNHGV